MDTAEGTFDMCSLTTGSILRTLVTPEPPLLNVGADQRATSLRSSKPRDSAIVERGAYVVGGSDHGSAYVFDARTGGVVQQLKHTQAGMLQTVTVSSLLEVCFCAHEYARHGRITI